MLRKVTNPSHTTTSIDYTDDEKSAMQRACLKLFSLWKVSDPEISVLVGGVSPKTIQRWRRGDVGKLSVDQADRLSNLLAIHKALRILFREPERFYGWIKRPNDAFNGQSALEVMLRGHLSDITRVRRYLDSVRGGW